MKLNRKQIIQILIILTCLGLLLSIYFGVLLYFVDPSSVPTRSIVEIKGVSLLWDKEMDINNPHYSGVTFFTPNERSVVFWSPKSASLISLDASTGKTIWESKVPSHIIMRYYDDRFFVPSYQSWSELEDAPVNSTQIFPDCSFGGEASLLTYDPNTGQQLWAYVYRGVDANDIFFDDENIYLTGSNDHGASSSIAQIDLDSGELLHLECNKWPNKKEIMFPPEDKGFGIEPFPYKKVYNEGDLDWRDVFLFFVPEGTRLSILDGITKNTIGYIEFDGFRLSPWHLDIAIQEEVAVIYLGDSGQLFGVHIPHMEELREAYRNRPKLEKDCCCD